MTTLRTAAQQALEALQLGYDSAKAEADQYHAAMAGYRPQRHAELDAEVQQIARAITALKAALADGDKLSPGEPVTRLFGTLPVYDTPPQRKPLTEEEISNLWSWSMTAEAERTATTQQHAFARAIERAHGIGGQP